MIKNVLKRACYLIVALSTIGGVAGLYQQVSSGSDYSLTLYLKSIDKIIENSSRMSDLRVYFNGTEITSLYITKIQLKNTGKRAFTKESIFEPLTISSSTPTKLFRVDCNNNLQSFTAANVFLYWNLFNPADVINCSLFSTEPLAIKVSHKIKEVARIDFINEIANPPTEQRIRALSLGWFFLIVFSILVILDAVLLIKADIKGSRVLGLIKSLSATESVNKEVFIRQLRNLYEDYYHSAKLFVTPDELVEHVSSQLSSDDAITDRYLEVARKASIEYVMNANLYNLRVYGVFYGPALLIICIVRISIYLTI